MKKLFSLIIVIVFMLTIFACIAFAEEAVVEAPSTAVTVNLTSILVAIIGLVFNFLLAWLGKRIIPPLKKWLEEKTTAEQRQSMWDVVVKLVEAAEQVIGSGNGLKKLRYVKNALEKAGYTVDGDLIEAAVKEMNDKILAKAAVAFDGSSVTPDPLADEELDE